MTEFDLRQLWGTRLDRPFPGELSRPSVPLIQHKLAFASRPGPIASAVTVRRQFPGASWQEWSPA
ncbi:hypothetical protein J2Z50_004725 [Ensifer mexicanus]|nr:hypothetical protein [Sinorhizobium mexicanum]